MGVVYDDETPAAAPAQDGFAARVLDQIANSKRPPRVVYDEDPNAPPTGTQTGAIVKGMLPVVGPLVEKGLTAAAAAPAAVLPGEGFGAMYNKMQAGQNQYERQHPISSAVGGLGGAVLGVPAMRAAPRAFGGNSFVGQTATGMGWGGADAAVRSGGDPHETAKGAFFGGAGPTLGSVLAPIGQAISSAGGAVARAVGIAPPRTRLTPQGALDAADTGFNSLGQLARYDPNHIDNLSNLIRRDFHTQSIATPRSAPGTHAVLADIGTLPPNPASLHNSRKQLQDVINGAGAGSAEGQAAIHARNMIDHFLENPPPGAVVAAPGQAGAAYQALQEANANWRVGRNAQEVARRHTAADTSAAAAHNPIALMPEGPEIVKQFKNLSTSRPATRFMSPEDIADVNRVVAPQSLGERGLRYAGALSGTSRPMTSILPSIGSYFAAGMDPTVAIAMMAGGGAAQAGASAMTRQAANAAEQNILSRSPYGAAALRVNQPPNVLGYGNVNPTAPQASIGAVPYRHEIARLLALQGERSAVEP